MVWAFLFPAKFQLINMDKKSRDQPYSKDKSKHFSTSKVFSVWFHRFSCFEFVWSNLHLITIQSCMTNLLRHHLILKNRDWTFFFSSKTAARVCHKLLVPVSLASSPWRNGSLHESSSGVEEDHLSHTTTFVSNPLESSLWLDTRETSRRKRARSGTRLERDKRGKVEWSQDSLRI